MRKGRGRQELQEGSEERLQNKMCVCVSHPKKKKNARKMRDGGETSGDIGEKDEKLDEM